MWALWWQMEPKYSGHFGPAIALLVTLLMLSAQWITSPTKPFSSHSINALHVSPWQPPLSGLCGSGSDCLHVHDDTFLSAELCVPILRGHSPRQGGFSLSQTAFGICPECVPGFWNPSYNLLSSTWCRISQTFITIYITRWYSHLY